MWLRLIQGFCLAKRYSLKYPKNLLPKEVQYLKSKFLANVDSAREWAYQQSLLAFNRLPEYYKDKSWYDMRQDSLFFLMTLTDFSFSTSDQSWLIGRVSSTYFKCLLYKQFGKSGEYERNLIIKSFNQNLPTMELQEIVFCLKIIHTFQESLLKIETEPLKPILQKYLLDEKYALQMLVINGSLYELGILMEPRLTATTIEMWIAKIKEWDFQSIYFIFQLCGCLQIKLSILQRQKLDRQMRKALFTFYFSRFEEKYILFLEQYYPYYHDKIQNLCFSPNTYKRYLRYLNDNPDLPIREHKIPLTVLKKSSSKQLLQIYTLRINLRIETVLGIAKSLQLYSGSSLRSILAFLFYLRVNEITGSLQFQYYIQKAFLLKLEQENCNVTSISKYDVQDVLNILAMMIKMRLGSVKFWERVIKWTEGVVNSSNFGKIVENTAVNYLNLLLLVTEKNFKEETREIIYQKVYELLSQNEQMWNIKSMEGLVKILTRGRIEELKLWLLIERRFLEAIKEPSQKSEEDIGYQQILTGMAILFDIMNKGSYEFWSNLDDFLLNSTKISILSQIKKQDSLARMHLHIRQNEQ